MRVIIYGTQGSGKSTQAKLLAEKLSVPMISTGVISRMLALQDNEEGRMVKALIDAGDPTPQEIITREIDRIIDSPEAINGFVMEGHPRYSHQLEPFIDSLKSRGLDIDKVFYIGLTEDEGIKRIMSRAKIEGRTDDTPEGIARRLQLYREQTQPIIDFFRKKGKLVEIDGSGTIEEVAVLINQTL